MSLFACVPASIAAKVKKCLYQENDSKVIKIKRRAGLFSQHRHCLQLNKDTAAQIANLNGPHYRLRKTPIAFIERRRMSHCPPLGRAMLNTPTQGRCVKNTASLRAKITTTMPVIQHEYTHYYPLY